VSPYHTGMAELAGYKVVFIGPDEEILDRKFFRSKSDAIKHAAGDGLHSVNGDVVRSEVWSPRGVRVWFDTDLRIEDQDWAKFLATSQAGLEVKPRRSRTRSPIEIYCERCQKVTWHRQYRIEPRGPVRPGREKYQRNCEDCQLKTIGKRIA